MLSFNTFLETPFWSFLITWTCSQWRGQRIWLCMMRISAVEKCSKASGNNSLHRINPFNLLPGQVSFPTFFLVRKFEQKKILLNVKGLASIRYTPSSSMSHPFIYNKSFPYNAGSSVFWRLFARLKCSICLSQLSFKFIKCLGINKPHKLLSDNDTS